MRHTSALHNSKGEKFTVNDTNILNTHASEAARMQQELQETQEKLAVMLVAGGHAALSAHERPSGPRIRV